MLCEPISLSGTARPALSALVPTPLVFTIYYISMPADLDYVYDWEKWEYECPPAGVSFTKQDLQEVYTIIAASSTAQAFLVTVEDLPLMVVEVYDVMGHDLQETYAAAPGDYYLRILLSPDARLQKCWLHGFRTALHWFFQFDEVRRILVPFKKSYPEEETLSLITRAGFIHLDSPTPHSPGEREETELYALSGAWIRGAKRRKFL